MPKHIKPKFIEIEQEIKPLSINQCWQGRRFKTPLYKDYEKELLLTLPKRKKVEGRVSVYIVFFFAQPMRRDVDNTIKPLLDILVKKGIIEDDRKVMQLLVRKEKRKKEGFDIFITEDS